MRKRIVIGLLALVVIGAIAYFVSQPKKGSVEWHKREYLAAIDRAAERTLRDRVRRAYAYVMGSKVDATTENEKRIALFEKLRQHENYLVALGFLHAKEVRHEGAEVSLKDGRTIGFLGWMVKETHDPFRPNGLTRRYDNMSPYARRISEGLVTIVIGTADDISKLEKMVRDEEASRREEVLRNFEADRLEGRK